MIAIIIGTFAGTVIALLVWEVWRERKKVSQGDPSKNTDRVSKLLRMTPAEREKYIKEGKEP